MRILITITSLLIVALNSLAYAADSKQVDIELQITHTPYVHFTGTAPGSHRMYDNNDIANWIYPTLVNIGTLGLESNMTGNCDISFSTVNNFDLLHTASSRSLTQYEIFYQSHVFGRTNNTLLTTLCNTAPTALEFKATGIVIGNFWEEVLIQSGVYRDIITVTVVTQ